MRALNANQASSSNSILFSFRKRSSFCETGAMGTLDCADANDEEIDFYYPK